MRKAILAAAVVSLASAVPVQGQVAWDGPLLVGTETPAGWGVYLVDPTSHSGIGFLTTWRGGGPTGWRIGIAEDGAEDLSVYGEVDFSGELVTAGDDFSLNVDWVTGASVGIGDDFVISLPLGISVGRGFETETVRFSPYITPRIVLDAFFGRDRGGNGNGGGDDLDLGLAVDFGLDISPNPGWAIRFGASGGDRDAVAIGVSFQVRWAFELR